jgi:S1-C subfamily serine protease
MKKLVFLLALLLTACSVPNKYTDAQNSTALLKTSAGQGSAFAVQRTNPFGKPRTFLWTANHVVEGFNEVSAVKLVRFEGRKVGECKFTATVIARDSDLDLALLSIDVPPGYFEPVRFAREEWDAVGAPVFIVGNFRGEVFDGSITSGIVSQVGVHVAGWPWSGPVDQMSAVVVPGASGGPVFSDGGVIGVTVGNNQPGVEFFVPVRAVRMFAARHRVQFAVDGYGCPGDGALAALADSARVVVPVLDAELKTILHLPDKKSPTPPLRRIH